MASPSSNFNNATLAAYPEPMGGPGGGGGGGGGGDSHVYMSAQARREPPSLTNLAKAKKLARRVLKVAAVIAVVGALALGTVTLFAVAPIVAYGIAGALTGGIAGVLAVGLVAFTIFALMDARDRSRTTVASADQLTPDATALLNRIRSLPRYERETIPSKWYS